MIHLAVYLAIGALFHLIFVGQHFDFSSALTWLWLFGWPLMLFFWLGVVAVIVAVVALLALGAAAVIRG